MGIFALGTNQTIPTTVYDTNEALPPQGTDGEIAWVAVPWDAIPGTSIRFRVIGDFFIDAGASFTFRVRTGGTPTFATNVAGDIAMTFDATGNQLINLTSAPIAKPTGISYLQFTIQRTTGSTATLRINSLLVEIVPDLDSNGILLPWFPGSVVTTASEFIWRQWAYDFDKLATSQISVGFACRTHNGLFQTRVDHNIRIGGTWGTPNDGTVVCTFNHMSPYNDGAISGVVSQVARPTGLQIIKATIQPGNTYAVGYNSMCAVICEVQ